MDFLAEIVRFVSDEPPPGSSPWVVPPDTRPVAVVDPRASWPTDGEALIHRVQNALGPRALRLDHIGSTSVVGLPAKPIIDIDLTVANPSKEEDWLPQLENVGFVLTVREPWWFHHRMLETPERDAHIHVFGPGSAEPLKHVILRNWLRESAEDRDLYAKAKRAAAAVTVARGETLNEYNGRKQQVLRAIYQRAFHAAGLTPL